MKYLKEIFIQLKAVLRSLQSRFQGLSFDGKLIVLGTLLFCLTLLGNLIKKTSMTNKSNTGQIQKEQSLHGESLNEMIPKGYVLVPIDIINHASLNAMMGDFAYVNLYAPKKTQKGSKLIGQNLKLIRTPKDPDQFALLIKEAKYINQLDFHSKYYVTIKNPTDTDQEKLINEPKSFKSSVSVSYQN